MYVYACVRVLDGEEDPRSGRQRAALRSGVAMPRSPYSQGAWLNWAAVFGDGNPLVALLPHPFSDSQRPAPPYPEGALQHCAAALHCAALHRPLRRPLRRALRRGRFELAADCRRLPVSTRFGRRGGGRASIEAGDTRRHTRRWAGRAVFGLNRADGRVCAAVVRSMQ